MKHKQPRIRKPAFVTAMEQRGVKLIYVGKIRVPTGYVRSKQLPKFGQRYLVWQHDAHFGWDAVLYIADGRSANVINYGLRHEPTAADTALAKTAFSGGLTEHRGTHGRY